MNERCRTEYFAPRSSPCYGSRQTCTLNCVDHRSNGRVRLFQLGELISRPSHRDDTSPCSTGLKTDIPHDIMSTPLIARAQLYIVVVRTWQGRCRLPCPIYMALELGLARPMNEDSAWPVSCIARLKLLMIAPLQLVSRHASVTLRNEKDPV